MSKQDKINKLKEYIKNLVVQELKNDDELDEVSTTATAGIDGTGTGHYDTPRAFASGSQGGHPNPEVVGYKKVNEGVLNELTDSQWRDANSSFVGNKYFPTMLKAVKKIIQDKDEKKLEVFIGANYRYFKNMSKNFKFRLKEGRYHDWRNDESMTPKQKVGRSMREIRDALNELDKTVKMNLKLKTELNMKSEDYWKNTHKALTKISERLVKMANKVGNLK